MRTKEPTGAGRKKTGAAGADLGLVLLGAGSAASALVPLQPAAVVAQDAGGARVAEGTPSGATLAGVGVGFLAIGVGAVVGARRRRWNVSEPIPPA